MGYIYRLDSKGRPFEFPACILEQAEYAKVISEINTNYALYKGQRFSIHYSIGVDNRYYMYFFENRGFNDYNIFEKYRY